MVARFQKGAQVRVRPFYEIQEQFEHDRQLPSGCFFQPPMDVFCEQVFTVSKAFVDDSVGTTYYRLYEVPEWSFTDEMLEDPSGGGRIIWSGMFSDITTTSA